MFYARLKKGIEVAVYYWDVYLQPNDERYISFPDHLLDLMKKDDRIEFKSEEEMQQITEEFNKKIEDIVNAHWRRAEKNIGEITDSELLKAIKKLATSLEKKKIVQIAKDRMEELEIKE